MKNLTKIKKDRRGHYFERIVFNTRMKKNCLTKIYGQFKICPVCKEPYFVSNSQLKLGRGKVCMHHNARCCGGRYKITGEDGYVRIYMPNYPCDSNGYVLEHRLVMEKYLGRYLTKEEIVHHINDVRDDNRIGNLMLFKSTGEHTAFHCLLKKETKKNKHIGKNIKELSMKILMNMRGAGVKGHLLLRLPPLSLSTLEKSLKKN